MHRINNPTYFVSITHYYSKRDLATTPLTTTQVAFCALPLTPLPHHLNIMSLDPTERAHRRSVGPGTGGAGRGRNNSAPVGEPSSRTAGPRRRFGGKHRIMSDLRGTMGIGVRTPRETPGLSRGEQQLRYLAVSSSFLRRRFLCEIGWNPDGMVWLEGPPRSGPIRRHRLDGGKPVRGGRGGGRRQRWPLVVKYTLGGQTHKNRQETVNECVGHEPNLKSSQVPTLASQHNAKNLQESSTGEASKRVMSLGTTPWMAHTH